MFNKLVLHHLIQVRTCIAQLRQSLEHFHNKVESVDLVLNSHVERSCDSTLLVVTANIQISVVSVVQQLVDECRIAMESEYDRLVLSEQSIELSIGQTVRMLALRLQLEQVNNVDESDLDLRHILSHDGNSCQSLQCRSIAAASQNYVRLLTLVVGSPLPDANTL